MMVSSLTLAELRYGIETSQGQATNRRALNRVLRARNVLAFDAKAADAYGSVRATLESAGNPVWPLDTLIAAHAFFLDATLVSSICGSSPEYMACASRAGCTADRSTLMISVRRSIIESPRRRAAAALAES